MIPTVFPIAVTQPDWKMLAQAGLVLGFEPYRTLDANQIRVNTLKGYLAAIGSIKNPKMKPDDQVRHMQHLLHHVHLSVMTNLPSPHVACLMSLEPGLTVLWGAHAVITASLKTWKELCLVLREENSLLEQRSFANQIVSILCALGLADMWFNLERKTLEDSTFLLE